MRHKSSARSDYKTFTQQTKTMKKLLFLLLIPIIFALGIFFWWQNGLSPVDSNNKATTMFVIPKGSGIRAIANDLKEQGLIKDDVVFFLYVRKNGIDQKIQAGDFRLSPSMPSQQIAKALTMGSVDLWVTVPEGKRAEEVAAILKEAMPTYDESWEEKLKEREGYLFPDTYLIPRNATIDQIISLMTNTFETRFAEVTNNTELSKEELVILASMIEREARKDEDRSMVSSVMHNRLKRGMPLDIDATVQYAIGTPEKWWPVLQDAARNIAPDSPYNTYTNDGLPPGPIANPGIAVMQAAGNPADTDYLFYITDKNGINRYGRTNAEHNENIRRYGL